MTSRQQGFGAFKLVLFLIVGFVVLMAVLYRVFVADQISSPRIILNAIFGTGIKTPGHAELEKRLQLAPGVSLGLFAKDLPNARWLAVTPQDDILLSRPRKGEVVLLKQDVDGNGLSDGTKVILSGLNLPHGLLLVGEWLYVAETDAIGRVRFDAEKQQVEGQFKRLVTGLPGGGNHWARNLGLGPDGWIYFNIGSSCNVCEEKDARRATMMRMRADGSSVETYATGLRNSTGFAWAPWDHQLYACDISRDLLGDDFPPDELNQVQKGGFYGWPYANSHSVSDPDFGHLAAAKVEIARTPLYEFRAHTTPLSIHFLKHPSLTRHWPKSAVVTLHGSWNRSVPDGYEVILLQWQADGRIVEKPLVQGFWDGKTITGRPVAVVEDSHGALYISDDYAGAVYRLVYNKP